MPTIVLPSVAPPPADAASLGKYGAVPVSMNTGSPDINVPLYVIKTPRLSLPISLNYSATGIKVDDLASWVGLEWSLNAGGVITRTVRGLDDFAGNGYYYSTVPQAMDVYAAADWSFFQGVMQHSQDNEPDFFFYNFDSYSGKFFFDPQKNPVIVNYQQPLTVQYNPTGVGYFTIQNEKGDTYTFNALENNTTSGPSGSPAEPYTSSWYLSSIVSFDRSDTISFSYFTDVVASQQYINYTWVVGPYYASVTGPNDGGNILEYISSGQNSFNSGSTTTSYPLRLQEIDYKNGKLRFFSSATRLDLPGVKLDSMIAYNYDYSSQQYDEVRKIKFSYDYYVSNSSVGTEPSTTQSPYRLRLDSLGIFGADSVSGGEYRFTYDPNMLPWVGSNARDQFGYYNGQNFNTTLIPTQTIVLDTQTYFIGGADRSVDPNYLTTGILTSITYPTGGFTQFSYESNSYQNTTGHMVTEVGADISAFGTFTQTDTATFVAPITVEGTVTVNITPYNYSDVHSPPYVALSDLTLGQVVYDNYYPNPNTGLNNGTAMITLYQGHTYQCIAGAFDDDRVSSQIEVTWQQNTSSLQILNGGGLRVLQTTDYDLTGKFLGSDLYKYGINESGYGILSAPVNLFNTNTYLTNFGYGIPGEGLQDAPAAWVQRETVMASTIYDLFSLSGPPVSYPEVTKYHVDSLGDNLGKSAYYYNFFQDSVWSVSPNYLGGLYVANSGWSGGELLLEEEYANKGGTYWPVKRTYHNYMIPAQPQGRGLKIGFNYTWSGGTPPMDSTDMVNGGFNTLYYWFDYPLFAGSVLPIVDKTIDYDQNDTTKFVTSIRQFTYDDLTHLQPTTIQSNLSDGDTLLTVNRYPAEIDSISGLSAGEITAIDSLQSRHALTTLIQTQTLRNGNPVDLVRYDYRLAANNMVLADSIEEQVAGFPIEKRIQFTDYDNYGNILQDAKASDVNHSYLWDYGHQYPIAEIINAAQSDVAYTSFEADGGGNWTIGSASRNRASALTGEQSYNLDSGSISASGLNSSATYIVSYWSENGSYSVTGNSSIRQGKTISIGSGNWTYYEHKISGVTSVTVSGSGMLDELRLYPLGAQMVTYTYLPLVGVTSQTDKGNRVTYYKYDPLGRLKSIRDQDQNILRTYDYQYQFTNSCGSNCFIVAMQTLAGTNTLSYPVGVFDVNGKLLGNVTSQSSYVSLWNADTADERVGTLVAGGDSLHFTITLNTGQSLPRITGCRYYQVDLAWNVFDAVRNMNGAYVDFGDSTGMYLASRWADTPRVLAPRTTDSLLYAIDYQSDSLVTYLPMVYLTHTYRDTSTKTITFYHNDGAENCTLDNVYNPASSLIKVKNLRGNLPQHTRWIGGSSYGDSSMTSVANITNWSSINSIDTIFLNAGDGVNGVQHVSYPQDFLAGDKGLLYCDIRSTPDTNFTMRRLKTDWNTYFTNLQVLFITDYNWNNEDLSALTNLWAIVLDVQRPSPTVNIDSVINQMAAGPGRRISRGVVNISYPGHDRTSASNAAYTLLKSRQWAVYINGVYE